MCSETTRLVHGVRFSLYCKYTLAETNFAYSTRRNRIIRYLNWLTGKSRRMRNALLWKRGWKSAFIVFK